MCYGEVKQDPDEVPSCYRVFIRGRTIPALAVSRSFGDLIGKTCGIISSPSTQQINMEDGDYILVICSDGIWDQVNRHEVAQILLSGSENCQHLGQNLQENVIKLFELASNRWKEEVGEYVDDITVLAYDVSFGKQTFGMETLCNTYFEFIK